MSNEKTPSRGKEIVNMQKPPSSFTQGENELTLCVTLPSYLYHY